MSRVAIHERPMWERTRFLAIKANNTTMDNTKKYFSTGESQRKPNTSTAGALTEPDGESLVNHFTRENNQSRKNCAASVATAR